MAAIRNDSNLTPQQIISTAAANLKDADNYLQQVQLEGLKFRPDDPQYLELLTTARQRQAEARQRYNDILQGFPSTQPLARVAAQPTAPSGPSIVSMVPVKK